MGKLEEIGPSLFSAHFNLIIGKIKRWVNAPGFFSEPRKKPQKNIDSLIQNLLLMQTMDIEKSRGLYRFSSQRQMLWPYLDQLVKIVPSLKPPLGGGCRDVSVFLGHTIELLQNECLTAEELDELRASIETIDRAVQACVRSLL